MKFCWTTIHVKSLKESLRFYQEVIGLKIVHQFESAPGMKIAMLGEEGQALIELIQKEGISQTSNHLSIGFMVPSIEEAMKHMEKNQVPIKSGPISPNPKTTFFFVEDPDGLEVQIVQQS